VDVVGSDRLQLNQLARVVLPVALLAGACGTSLGLPGSPDASGTLSDAAGHPSGDSDIPSDTPDAGVPLGATPLRSGGNGVHFRVWAPNATSVAVEGDWNSFSQTADPMTKDPDGTWRLDIATATVGQSYAYRIVNGTAKGTRADPRAFAMTNAAGKSIIVDQNAFAWQSGAFTEPALSNLIIYELHLGSFNVDPANAGTKPGTWATAMAKLDYLVSLGVNAVEIMPPAEFPGSFSWGYNPAYPMAPASAYGTPDDARRFIDAAHARGIAVLIDVVHNHWGPTDLSMWCFDLTCNGAGGIYFYTGTLEQTDWGPRPNYATPEVRAYIEDDTRMWLDTYRADGLRWDSTVNIRSASGTDIPDGISLLREINDMVDATAPTKIMIAEDMQSWADVTTATASGGLGFDSQWDPGFCNPIDDAIINSSDANRDMNAVANALRGGDASWKRVIFTESHDQVANGRSRVPEMITPGDPGSIYARKRSTLGAALALTAPGIPMLFEGQELLTGGAFDDNVPIDWTRATTYAGILQIYQDLIALRLTSNDTRGLRGAHTSVYHVDDTNKLIAFHRWDAGGVGDDTVVVANFANRTQSNVSIGFPAAGTWHARFNSDSQRYSPDYGNTPSADITTGSGTVDQMAQHGAVTVGPYSVVVYSR
jgi:1,4-alpha-glucan branching enzyme